MKEFFKLFKFLIKVWIRIRFIRIWVPYPNCILIRIRNTDCRHIAISPSYWQIRYLYVTYVGAGTVCTLYFKNNYHRSCFLFLPPSDGLYTVQLYGKLGGRFCFFTGSGDFCTVESEFSYGSVLTEPGMNK